MVTTWLLTMAGFILIFIELDLQWTAIPINENPHAVNSVVLLKKNLIRDSNFNFTRSKKKLLVITSGSFSTQQASFSKFCFNLKLTFRFWAASRQAFASSSPSWRCSVATLERLDVRSSTGSTGSSATRLTSSASSQSSSQLICPKQSCLKKRTIFW